jgi:hypothetical protein
VLPILGKLPVTIKESKYQNEEEPSDLSTPLTLTAKSTEPSERAVGATHVNIDEDITIAGTL